MPSGLMQLLHYVMQIVKDRNLGWAENMHLHKDELALKINLPVRFARNKNKLLKNTDRIN